jgi:type IV secretion system protein VirB10
MTELGTEVARRNLRIQPTIEVRKGYRMNVMVNKDIVFPGSYQP